MHLKCMMRWLENYIASNVCCFLSTFTPSHAVNAGKMTVYNYIDVKWLEEFYDNNKTNHPHFKAVHFSTLRDATWCFFFVYHSSRDFFVIFVSVFHFRFSFDCVNAFVYLGSKNVFSILFFVCDFYVKIHSNTTIQLYFKRNEFLTRISTFWKYAFTIAITSNNKAPVVVIVFFFFHFENVVMQAIPFHISWKH